MQLGGCTLRLNEEAVKFQSTQINPVQEGCLSNVDVVIQQYFDGKINEKELEVFWDCLHRSFELFLANTKGANPDYYTPEELGGFLEKYFLRGKNIHPELLHEAMVLKQAIIGGEANKLTKIELTNTLTIIQSFKIQTLLLRPFLPLSFSTAQDHLMDESMFEKAITVFHQSMENLGRSLEKSVNSYSFDNLNSLLKELETFLSYKGEKNIEWIRAARKYLKILRSTKSILISPPDHTILASDFKKIFELAPRYYTLFLRTIYYMHSNYSLLHGIGLSNINNFASDLKSAVLNSMRNHPSNTISLQEINSLIDALDEHKLLPVSPKTIKDFLPILFFRIFPSSKQDIIFLGISENSVNRIWEKFSFWSEGQHYLAGMFNELNRSIEPEEKALQGSDILSITPEYSLKWTQLKNELSLESVSDLQKIVSEVKATNPPKSNIVTIPGANNPITYSFSHLSRMNWLRTIARIVYPTYSTAPDRAKNLTGMTVNEVNSFYRDIFPLAVELKLLSPESAGAATSRFFEANLFLFNSDGNNLISINEALELGTIGLSTIYKAASIHASLASICEPSETDPQGKPIIEARCFKENFLKNLPEYWNQVPNFKTYFETKMPNESNDDFFKRQNILFDTLDNLVRTKKERKILSGISMTILESQGFILMPYYIEVIYNRFDANNSGTLNQNEAKNAFPIFEQFIAEKASKFGLDSKEDHKALFTYLLKYGELPNDSFSNKLRFIYWRYVSESSFETDRGMILKLFSKLMSL